MTETQSSIDKIVAARDCQDDINIGQHLGETEAKMRAHHEPPDRLMHKTSSVQLNHKFNDTIAASEYLGAHKPQWSGVSLYENVRQRLVQEVREEIEPARDASPTASQNDEKQEKITRISLSLAALHDTLVGECQDRPGHSV